MRPGILLAVLAAGLIATGCGDNSPEQEFDLALPSGWVERDTEFNQAAGQAGGAQLQKAGLPSGGLVPLRVLTRERGGGDQTTASVTVFVENLPEGESLRRVVEGGAAAVEPILGGEVTSALKRLRIDGEKAFGFSYQASSKGSELRFEIVQTLRDDKVYSATLTSPAKQAAVARREFAQILESWDWS